MMVVVVVMSGAIVVGVLVFVLFCCVLHSCFKLSDFMFHFLIENFSLFSFFYFHLSSLFYQLDSCGRLCGRFGCVLVAAATDDDNDDDDDDVLTLLEIVPF